MINLKEHIDYLGLKAKDKVTGFRGVITTVAFDLYGCIQVVINPGIDKDGKILESAWFDIARIQIVDDDPVMEQPDFNFELKGPESKSIPKN